MHQARLVSVIINNYNYARFLGAAIDSVLGQTYPHIEVIVVDDGSTDNSRAVIEGYGERVVPVFKENGGQASACNAGFARSRGELIIFLDADDVLLPAIVEHVVEAFAAHPHAAKAQFRMEVIGANGDRTGTLKPPSHVPLLSGDLRRHYLTFPDDVMRMPTSANAFPAHVLRQMLPVPERTYRGGADTYLAHISPLFGTVVTLDEIGAYYRVHGTNNYEVESLNLTRVRRNVTHSYQTHRHIVEIAERIGLPVGPNRAEDILSVSYIASRMISLKLDPAQHPLKQDRLWDLLILGIRAALERFDEIWLTRLMFLSWFLAMAPAPRPLAWWLAEQLYFPSARRDFNHLLAALHARAS